MDHTPLHVASEVGNIEMVEFLIQYGADINAERSGIYATPLCWADNHEIALYLLDNGATMKDKELYLATRMDKIEVVDLLLTRGAQINNSEPQYLVCSSIACIQIYIKHKIKIDGVDNQNSNLLHKLSWLDIPEVFDFAYKQSCPWKRDSSQRTPYNLARQGRRENILTHFREHYSELIAHKIENYSTIQYKHERLFFLKQNPIQSDCFIGLTKKAKLIKYLLVDGELVIDRIATIDIALIRNFTFDKGGNIIIPTADNKLLAVDQNTFQFMYSIELNEELNLDQIEYLPLKNMYVGSSDNWEIVLLSPDFNIINRTRSVDGTIFPIINQDESLIAFMSYDQATYFNLYTLKDNLSVDYVHTFFKDWKNTSSGFFFNKNEFVVTFPNEIEYYTFENEILNKHWEVDISKYKSEHELSYSVFIDDDTILAAKGKKLLYIDKVKKMIEYEVKLNLLAEIRDVYLDKAKHYIIVSTDSELKLVYLRNIKWKQGNNSPTGSYGFLKNLWNRLTN